LVLSVYLLVGNRDNEQPVLSALLNAGVDEQQVASRMLKGGKAGERTGQPANEFLDVGVDEECVASQISASRPATQSAP